MPIPALRVTHANDAPVRADADYVLYWMTASRRPSWNFALDRAIEWARQTGRPLIVFEALRAGYAWASDRFHAFILQGMADNAQAFGASRVTYYPYVEREPGDGKGLLEALAARAAVIVTDDYPAFFHRRMVAAAAPRLDVRLEAVDSNGLVPLRATGRAYPTAFTFRLFLQKHLREHLTAFPAEAPLDGLDATTRATVPAEVLARWPLATSDLLSGRIEALRHLPIDHAVAAVEGMCGGWRAAREVLATFLEERLPRYADERNQPEEEVASGLSPWLHFGHVSVHEIFSRLMSRERWTTRALAAGAKGSREGWWGTSRPVESFLDELITWREVGYNMCHHRADYERYESLPDWARATLDAHTADERAHVYPLEAFEAGATHDPLWNAAQTQLRREGRIHNYLRMLWGKKILEWTASPREALAVMIELNNKYALDGRDPNSYSGIFWVLGRYDRPWAPERPVYGTIRYMSSDNTARKLRVRKYIERYA